MPKGSLADFAARIGLRIKGDGCGDPTIPGNFGHLYEHGTGCFGLVLEEPADTPSRPKSLLARRRLALAAGFSLHQEGDVEAILLFDPADERQARLAVKLARARRRRRVGVKPASLANLHRRSTQKRGNGPAGDKTGEKGVGSHTLPISALLTSFPPKNWLHGDRPTETGGLS